MNSNCAEEELLLIKLVYSLVNEKNLVRANSNLKFTGRFIPTIDTIDTFNRFGERYNNESYRASFSEIKLGESSEFSLILNRGSDSLVKFYIDINDFFNRIKTQKVDECLNDKYYIIEDEIDFNVNSWSECFSNKVNNLKSLIKVVDSLERLAHHTSGSEDLIFISHKDESDKSIVINKSLKSLPENLLTNTLYNDFLKDGLLEGSYELKIKSIFRSSLVEFFDKTNKKDKLYYLLDNYKKFEEVYSKNHEVFISGVSLNKIKSELVQEQIKLFDSVNKGMQEVTNRVMLLPGIGFLVMLLRSQEKSYENSVIVVLSLLVVSIVILISVFNQESMLSILKKTHIISIENLSKLTDSTREGLSSVLSEMESLADNTENILLYFKLGLWILPSLFVIFMSGLVGALIYYVLYFICYYYVRKGFGRLAF